MQMTRDVLMPLAFVVFGQTLAIGQSPTAGERCTIAAFDGEAIDRTVVRSVRLVTDGGPAAPAVANLPAFCRVEAAVTTAPDSVVNFEVWVPQDWNGKIVVTGNGGYSNALNYRDMAHALSQRYAAVGGDTGHQTPTPDDLLWGVGHPERIIDWGSRSIHAITVPSRRIVERVQGSSSRRAYFYGCSTGGHQGYAEIQRYPEDFDGVIAGAPGNNRVRLTAGFLWQFLSNHQAGENTTAIIPASKLPVVTNAVVAACDANDGVKDGVLDDPRTCRFDPASLKCKSDQKDCLSPPQVAALRKMYQGARNPRTGAQVYPGWPVGSEALTASPDGKPLSGWHMYWGNAEPTRAAFWRHWVFADAAWNWWSFDFDRDLAQADERVGEWSIRRTPISTPSRREAPRPSCIRAGRIPSSTRSTRSVTTSRCDRAKDRRRRPIDFFRLFLVPGLGHCRAAPARRTSGTRPRRHRRSTPTTICSRRLMHGSRRAGASAVGRVAGRQRRDRPDAPAVLISGEGDLHAAPAAPTMRRISHAARNDGSTGLMTWQRRGRRSRASRHSAAAGGEQRLVVGFAAAFGVYVALMGRRAERISQERHRSH